MDIEKSDVTFARFQTALVSYPSNGSNKGLGVDDPDLSNPMTKLEVGDGFVDFIPSPRTLQSDHDNENGSPSLSNTTVWPY